VKTPITEQLGIEFPIFAFTHCRDVVAAVTKAGGMGVLGAAGHSAEQLAIDLEWIEKEVGDKPYGIDLLIPSKYVGASEGREYSREELAGMIPAEHKAFLDDVMVRYDVPEAEAEGGTTLGIPMGTLGVTPTRVHRTLETAFGFNPRVLVSALGTPPRDIVDECHAKGMQVGALAGAPRHAVKHKEGGLDFIVAQGTEAAGHTGEISTMVLIPQVVDAVGDLPVLAAGGIGDGRQMAAALALGAQGVWCGSIWLTTDEAETSPEVKDKLIAATSLDTKRSRSMTGKPARLLKTAWVDEWDAEGAPAPLMMPLQSMLVGPYTSRIERSSHRVGTGAWKLATAGVGQIVGMMNTKKTSGQVVFDLVDQYLAAVERIESINAE